MLRLIAAIGLLASPTFADPKFQKIDVAPHVYGGGWEHFVGGGVAVFDCNDDDLPEVFVSGGENKSSFYRNTSQVEVVQLKQDTPGALALHGVIGAYPIDINNDMMTDLVVLRVGPNVVLKGGMDCSFTPLEGLNIDLGNAWTTAFSAAWQSGNTLPTLAFGNYVDRSDPDGPFEACDDSILQRPEANSYAKLFKLVPSFCPLSMLFSDWQRNGQRDLRISNDRHYYVSEGQEQMWMLADKPRLYTDDDGWIEHKLWGMGIASRDLTGDGLPEVMMTSMGDQRMQTRDLSREGVAFVDVPFDLGTTAHRPYVGGDGRPSTGWHVQFGDVQNDGRDDIFIAKGNVEQMPGLAMKDPNNLLIQNNSGTFEEVGESAGLASLQRGRGAALVDLNGDGLLDVIVVNRRAPMEVYQNVTIETGNWIGLALHQDGANTDAIGAWITVKANGHQYTREITVGGGHAGGQLGVEHFGLGTADKGEVQVLWPDGRTSDWLELAAGQVHHLNRDNDMPQLVD